MRVLLVVLLFLFFPLKAFSEESLQGFAKANGLSIEVQTQDGAASESQLFPSMKRENLFQLLRLLQTLPYTGITGDALAPDFSLFKITVSKNPVSMDTLPPEFAQVQEKLFSSEVKLQTFTLMGGIFNGYGTASSSAKLKKYFSQFRQLTDAELKALAQAKSTSIPLQFYIQMNSRDIGDPAMGLNGNPL